MARILDVLFYGNKAGQLAQDDSGRLQFAYNTDCLGSKNNIPVLDSILAGIKKRSTTLKA